MSEMMEAWNEFCKAHKVLGDSPEFEVLRTGGDPDWIVLGPLHDAEQNAWKKVKQLLDK